jgi:hypothetical protein
VPWRVVLGGEDRCGLGCTRWASAPAPAAPTLVRDTYDRIMTDVDATALWTAGDLWRAPQKSHKYASRTRPHRYPTFQAVYRSVVNQVAS